MSEEIIKKDSVATKAMVTKKESAKDVTSKNDAISKNDKSGTKPKVKRRKNVHRQIQRGKAFIISTYNNTKVSFSDLHGNILAWSSSGSIGFKGAKKATTYAANQVLNNAHERVQRYGLKDVEVFVKGVGSGRDAALRALVQKGYNLVSIKDITPIPHNGCRSKKLRRV